MKTVFLLLLVCTTIAAAINLSIFVDYFQLKGLSFVTVICCKQGPDIIKIFSQQNIRAVVYDIDESSKIQKPYYKQGIMLDLSCSKSLNFLQHVNQDMFGPLNVWLIVLTEFISLHTLTEYANASARDMFNMERYLNSEPELNNEQHRKRLRQMNFEINADLLTLEIIKNKTEYSAQPSLQISTILNLPALMDSEVTIAVPNSKYNDFNKFYLLEVYRVLEFSAMLIQQVADINKRNGVISNFHLHSLKSTAATKRKNLNGAILKAAAAFHYLEYFSRSNELTQIRTDIWAQMTFDVLKLVEEMLNFRMLVKCLDQYGWPNKNGTFSGLTDFIKEKKAHLTATGLILRSDGLQLMDYVDSTFNFETGILFRQPTLPSVQNIFTLPFLPSVWFTLVILLCISAILLYWQLYFLRYHNTNTLDNFTKGDVVIVLFGILTQQGNDIGIPALSLRLSMAALLFMSLFLFSSYSATIITLLQSRSTFISSLKDLLDSNLDFGIEDLVYHRKLIMEDKNTLIDELLSKKLHPKGECGYLSTNEGIKLVRDGPFAFQVELSSGYRAVLETFKKEETCDLSKINLLAFHVLGPAVAKKSPYRKIFALKFRWLKEIGLINRIHRRWTIKKPACKSLGGFTSVGLEDVLPLMFILIYGTAIAIGIFLLEHLIHKKGNCFLKDKKISC